MGKRSREKWEMKQAGASEVKEKFISQTGLEKVFLFVIRWGTYLVLFTPLIISVKFFFPFVTPKTIFFRIILEIIAVSYIFLVIANRNFRPRINVLTMALALFLAVFILASFAGVNLSRSFWSTYERMTGILTMLHLFAFFIILSSTFKKREDWQKFLGVSVIVGVLLSLYIFKGSEISTRGGGTIGNTSFMAAYLLFDVFFALLLFLSNFLKKGIGPLFWQIFSAVSLLVMLPVLFKSTARGAIVAFFIGLFLLFLGYLIFSKQKYLKRLGWVIILLLVISITVLAVFQPLFIKEKVQINLAEMKSRFLVWETGWKGFSERPVLGWGPENFNNVFLKYFNPCMSLAECGTEVWFDRVHNIILDTLVTTGIAGFLSYLVIFGATIYGLLKVAAKATERKNIFIPLGLLALLVAYFFQNLLVFDMINTYLVFFLSLAFANFLIQEPSPDKEIRRRVNPFLAFVVIIVMAFVLWATNIQPLRANYYIIKTIGSQYADEFSLFFQKSLNTWMEKYETREQVTQKLIKSSDVLSSLAPEQKEVFSELYDFGEREMEKSIQENYLDFRPHLFLGQLYWASYRMNGNPEKLIRAEKILEEAIELSPTNQQGYWLLAEVKLAQGKPEEVVSILEKAVDLEPRSGLAHWYFALIYNIMGQYELALQEIYKAEKVGYDWRSNPEQIEKVLNIYKALGKDPALMINEDSERRIEHDLKALEQYPNDKLLWFDLLAAYANVDRNDEVREAAKKALELNPDFKPEVEEFLKTLPQ